MKNVQFKHIMLSNTIHYGYYTGEGHATIIQNLKETSISEDNVNDHSNSENTASLSFKVSFLIAR